MLLHANDNNNWLGLTELKTKVIAGVARPCEPGL